MNCCDTYGNCDQGRNCPARKCTEPTTPPAQTESAEPSAPLADANQFLTTAEWAMVCTLVAVTTGFWVAGLACVSGFVWERWLGDFMTHAISWLRLP